jgi:copper(I)-binding protein
VNRALRAATMGALLLSPIALSACGAGQVTQTAQQERDRVGGMADAGTITLRAVTIESPSGGSFGPGDDVELFGAIVNTGDEVDTLESISGEGFEDARLLGGTTGVSEPGGSGSGLGVEIPRDDTVFLGDDAAVLLENLTEELTAGQSLELTLTFEQAGDVTVVALVANPDERDDREAFDFHHEEEAEGESASVEGG